MMLPELAAAVVQGIVEGVTEFIPVSSTGHLIVAGQWLGFSDERAKTFDIFIQLGAILAVVWIYRARFLEVARTATREPASRQFVTNLVLGFIPAAVVGLLTHHWIKAHLFSAVTVAWAFIIGGLLILMVERWRPEPKVIDARDLQPRTAFFIGVIQVLALFPGMSRSGATIMGGYALGLSRTAATEFSFFLGVPVLAAAAGFDLVKSRAALAPADLPLFAVGTLVAFVSAMIVVKAFLRYVSRHSFAAFAWYRIGFGALLLWLVARGLLPPA